MWGRAWNAVEAHRPGLVHIWWGELDQSAVEKPQGTLTPAEIVRQVRAEAEVREAGRTVNRLDIDNTPRRWGTFADAAPPPAPFAEGTDAAYGWPRPCLWYQIRATYNQGARAMTGDHLRYGLRIAGDPAARGEGFRVLPLRPIAAGTLVNTAFYGALWALLLAGPVALRRRSRRRRGRCPACGYDLRAGAHERCPECGVAG
jgi:hypothetical protein